MNEIDNVNGVPYLAGQLRVLRPGPQARNPVSRGTASPQDRVEISELANVMGRLRSMPEVRRTLVERIRAEIEAGGYETPERINGTIEAVLEELGY